MTVLTAAQRGELDAIAVPVENGALVACTAGGPDEHRLAWMFDGGRRKEPFGPRFASVLLVVRAAQHLNLRISGPATW